MRARFPKQRPTLPASYAALYEQEYKRNRGSQNANPDLKQKLESWMHRRVSEVRAPEGDMLETGAGTLNQVPWEREGRADDVVEPSVALYRDQPARAHLRPVYRRGEEIPTTARYAKIVSVAVLEHVEDLPSLVARSALLLRDDGVAAHGIPSEGGLLWYLAWRFGTGSSFRLRTGLPYAPLMRHEHVNNAMEIIRVLGVFFSELSYRRFPLPILHGSFYTCVVLRKPIRAMASAFLSVTS